MLTASLPEEKLLQRNSATAFCSSTVMFSKSSGYFMRNLSFLSSWRKDQKSSLSAPAARSRNSFTRISQLSDLNHHMRCRSCSALINYYLILSDLLSCLCSSNAPTKLSSLTSRIQASSFMTRYSLRSARQACSLASSEPPSSRDS